MPPRNRLVRGRGGEKFKSPMSFCPQSEVCSSLCSEQVLFCVVIMEDDLFDGLDLTLLYMD